MVTSTLIIIGAVVVFLLATSLRVVKEYDRGVIFFLGKCTEVASKNTTTAPIIIRVLVTI
jgi:regulator of protease activity HflC (stomatin/prohibitin superfamily)